MEYLEAMKKAKTVLETLDRVDVRLRGEPLPETKEQPLILLDGLSSTPYGYDQTERIQLQVSVYATDQATVAATVKSTKTPLKRAGFVQGQTRTAPGEETGQITDWRIG